MAIIKVVNNLFSSTKSLEKALHKCAVNDDIHVAPAHYTETLYFGKSVHIHGEQRDTVIIEGTLIIPAETTVSFHNVTIMPTAHVHIEGTAHFDHCTFLGQQTNAILSLATAHVTAQYCHFQHAKDVAIAAFKNSHVALENCTFEQNGKTHLLFDRSSGSIRASTFTKSTHAIWMKNDASVLGQHNRYYEQQATQIIVQQSSYEERFSQLQHSEGNGVFASKQSHVQLIDCYIAQHKLPQIWLQDSELHCTRTTVEDGAESGMMIRSHSQAHIVQSTIQRHHLANVQVCLQSTLHIEHSKIDDADGMGIHLRDKSVLNVLHCTLKRNKMAQLFMTDTSIASINDTMIEQGLQVGIIVENNSECTLLHSTIHQQHNSGLTLIDSQCTMLQCVITDNNGNGLLALNNSSLQLEHTHFEGNKMPHIGAKNTAQVDIHHCYFEKGKTLFLVEHAQASMTDCKLMNGDGVQIELSDHSKGTFTNCEILNGKTNAMKFIRNSSAHINDCIIAQHQLPQIVANDSSFILKNSEVIDGARNGFIIENNAEAHIEDTFIARHRYPQIWVDLHSIVELQSVQLTEGAESDLYLQNDSNLVVYDSFIKNLTFTYNIKSVNHSKIELHNTVIEHFSGDCFYTENNSEIIATMDDPLENRKK